MKKELKQIIYYVMLGASLVAYAHTNFATKYEITEVKNHVDGLADKTDLRRIEEKLDTLIMKLMGDK